MKEKITQKSTSRQMDLLFIAQELISGYFRPMLNGGSYSELGAMIKLFELCAHANYEVLKGPHPGYCQQWSTRTSLNDLAEQFGWSRSRTDKFLKKMTRLGIIRLEPATDGTVIYLKDFGD